MGRSGVNSSKNMDLTPNGKRALRPAPPRTKEAPAAQNHIVFLMNFFNELRRKVPVVVI